MDTWYWLDNQMTFYQQYSEPAWMLDEYPVEHIHLHHRRRANLEIDAMIEPYLRERHWSNPCILIDPWRDLPPIGGDGPDRMRAWGRYFRVYESVQCDKIERASVSVIGGRNLRPVFSTAASRIFKGVAREHVLYIVNVEK